jgi:hypothetical protein
VFNSSDSPGSWSTSSEIHSPKMKLLDKDHSHKLDSSTRWLVDHYNTHHYITLLQRNTVTEAWTGWVSRGKLDFFRHARSSFRAIKATCVVTNKDSIRSTIEHVLLGSRVPVLQVFARNVDDRSRDTVGRDVDLCEPTKHIAIARQSCLDRRRWRKIDLHHVLPVHPALIA